MIVDIKYMTLTRKARLIDGGHKTEVPNDSVYSCVVSRESVRLVFLTTSLNDLKIKAIDIQNSYLDSPTKEKVHILCDPEFDSNQDRTPVVVQARHEIRSSGVCFRKYLV